MNASEITPEQLEKEAAEKAGLMGAVDVLMKRVHEIDGRAAAVRIAKLAALNAKHAENDAKAIEAAADAYATARAEIAARRRVVASAPTHDWLAALEDRAERQGEAS